MQNYFKIFASIWPKWENVRNIILTSCDPTLPQVNVVLEKFH